MLLQFDLGITGPRPKGELLLWRKFTKWISSGTELLTATKPPIKKMVCPFFGIFTPKYLEFRYGRLNGSAVDFVKVTFDRYF